jgi:hypothetical protein
VSVARRSCIPEVPHIEEQFMKARVVWTHSGAVLALGLLSSFSRAAMTEPATPEASCKAQCQVVLGDCKQLCAELGSGKISDYKGASDEERGGCLEKCEADLEVCRANC